MRLLPALAFALTAAAATPATASGQEPALPRLAPLGPVPDTAPAFAVQKDGSLTRLPGGTLSWADFVAALQGHPEEVVLHADAATPAAVVGALVEQCERSRVRRVAFAATLPTGADRGAFTLALPEGPVAPVIALRLHRDRPGVPPDAVALHLARVHRGLPETDTPSPTLGVTVPGDAAIETVLQVLAAATRGGSRSATVRWERTAGQERAAAAAPTDLAALARATPAAPGPVAIDLDLGARLPLPALALPGARATLQAGSAGFVLPPAPYPGVDFPGGQAGGRYGGRAGAARARVVTGVDEGIASRREWLRGQQTKAGSFADRAGRDDLQATALVALSLLGDGHTLRDGGDDILAAAIGWLMAQQDETGRIGPGGRGATARHAMATYALVEACGLSPRGPLLRGHVQDALGWLKAQRQPDGGWNDGTPGAAADTLSTAWSAMALCSAAFFRFEVQVQPSALAGWFDLVADPATGEHRMYQRAATAGEGTVLPTAAALCSRFFAGQDPGQAPVMERAADFLLAGLGGEDLAATDPHAVFWTTYACYQVGKEHWARWSKRLTASLAPPPDPAAPASEGASPVQRAALHTLTLQAYYRYTRLVR